MKNFFFIFLYLISLSTYSQCVGIQSSTISPSMSVYPGGSQIQVCYTMDGWNPLNSNWVEGFEITLSPGPLTNVTNY